MTTHARTWTLILGSSAFAACLISALYGTLSGSWDRWPTGWIALAAQLLLLLALAIRALDEGARWATAEFTVLAAWFALFAVPSGIFLIRPELLERTTSTPVTETIALVNLALFALAAGLLARGKRTAPLDGAISTPREFELRTGVLAAWFGAGVAGLVLLFSLRGGPIEYLTNLDDLGAMTAGLLPVVWLAQCTRYAATLAVVARWAQGGRVTRGLFAFAFIGITAAGLIGARAFVAVAAVQLLLSYAVLRGRPALRTVVPVALVAALVLTFGAGALKRYSNYTSTHPSNAVGLGEYLVSIAPREAVEAYATNYADGVRYVGLALEVVPRYADHEGVASIQDLATRVIPRRIRPEVDRQPVIAGTFLPRDGAAPAIPLMVVLYLGGGAAAVVLGLAMVGVGATALDRSLAQQRHSSFPVVVTKIALIVQLPILIRSGIPAGVVFLMLDVLAVYVIAATSVRTPQRTRARRRHATVFPLVSGAHRRSTGWPR